MTTESPRVVAVQAGDSTENVLEAHEVTKRFGGLVAVKQVDMNIRRGMIYSLIGPNGAGKTTLFNVIAGILPPTFGDAMIRVRRLIAPAPRAWLEPIVWFTPFFVILAIGLSFAGANVRN